MMFVDKVTFSLLHFQLETRFLLVSSIDLKGIICLL